MITQVTSAGAAFTLSFQSQPGFVYSVEYADNLRDVSWTRLQPIVAGADLSTVRDIAATTTTRFYRIAEQGPAPQVLAYIPQLSQVTTNQDGSLSVMPPNGWIYVGVDPGDNLIEVASGGTKVSCTCSTSGSCTPFKGTSPFGTAVGCTSDGCSKCNMTNSAAIAGTVFAEGGYLDLTQSPTFVTQATELPGPFPAMFRSPEVTNAIANFVSDIYTNVSPPQLLETNGSIVAPDGFSLAVVNVFGRAVILPVPTIALPAGAAAGSKASCSGCSSGSGCKLKEYGLGSLGAVSCEPGCPPGVTCTLTTSVTQPSGNATNLTAMTYQALSYTY